MYWDWIYFRSRDRRPVGQREGYGVAVPLETFWRPWRSEYAVGSSRQRHAIMAYEHALAWALQPG